MNVHPSIKTLFKSPLFLLFLITLFGAVIRAWFFWTDTPHTDEKFTLDLVQNSVWYIITFSLTNDCNPPLFYVIDWVSVHMFGLNMFAERLPSVIFGILLIPAVYMLGKEWRNETLGVLSSLAVSTLGSMWYYSQFGRAYMLECLLFTVAMIYYIRLVRGDSRTYHWVSFAVLSAVLAFTHLFSIIPLTLLWLYLIWEYKIQAIKWCTLTFILSSPLLLLFNAILTNRLNGQFTSWYGPPFSQLVAFTPLEFFGYVFVFWIPMIAYGTYLYWRQMREIAVVIVTSVISYITLISLCDITPVFIRYLMLLVPTWLVIGLLPISEFMDSKDATPAQKWFVIGSFGICYFVIIAYSILSGLYRPKG